MSQRYRVVVRGFTIKLNELLAGRMYDYRTKKYRNAVKSKGDSICIRAIKGQLRNLKIDKPIIPHYWFYVPDRKSDRDGIISPFMKCFLDALQKADVIVSDGWNYVLTPVIEDMQVDKNDPRIVVELEVSEEKGDIRDSKSVVRNNAQMGARKMGERANGKGLP